MDVTYVGPRARVGNGPIALLTLYLAFVFVLPARRVIGPLGGVGRPEVIVGLVGLLWWIAQHAIPGVLPRVRQPIRYVLYAFLGAFLLAYFAGLDRGVPTDEGRAMDRALIAVLALAGVALLILDCVSTRQQLDQLLRRLTYGGAFMATVGAVQFLTGFDPAPDITLPGLSLNASLFGFGERGTPGFRRIAGTAAHPIEFGVVAAMIVPIAIHYAAHARTRRDKVITRAVLLPLLLAVPFSISRSAVLALGAVLLVMIPIWSRTMVKRAVVVLLGGSVALRVLEPGLLGTLRQLFANLGSDPSIQGRTSDYGAVFGYVAQRPLIGRGPRTFLPQRYIVLDNEILNTLVCSGFVGLAALLALPAGAWFTARSTYRHSLDDVTRHLAQSLAAPMLAVLVVLFTFDALSFTLFSATLFVVVGSIGALWRLDRTPGQVSERPPRDSVLARPRSAQGAR
jgi:hypothetical protein